MVNREKSCILFFPNTSRTHKRQIKDKWGLKSLKVNQAYLGNSLVMNKNLTKELSKVKDRVQRRLEGWQSKLLSNAGKATLIRSVVMSTPVYTMSTFRIPKSVCESLESMVRRFWWGAKPGSNRFLALKS